MRSLFAAAMITVALLAWAVSGNGAEIPAIKALNELRTLPAISLPDGWTVRVAMGEPEPTDAPWKMLYCLADPPAGKPRGLDVEGAIPGEILGPVFFSCSWGDRNNAMTRIKASTQAGGPGPNLFYAVVPLVWKGTCHIRIMNRAGDVLLSKEIIVPAEPAIHWQTFVASDYRKEHNAPYALAPDPAAAVPASSGMSAIAPADAAAATRPAELSLRLEDGNFVIRSSERVMIAMPKQNLLARWWVNDKPVIPDRAKRLQEMFTGLIGRVREIRTTFGLPATLGKLRAGDRVSLQLLYAPGGHAEVEPAPDSATRQMIMPLGDPGTISLPTLTNRIDFVLTEDMLAKTATK